MHWCSASIITATPRGFRRLVDGRDDLGGQPLLRLQAMGEDVDDAGELRQADDPSLG